MASIKDSDIDLKSEIEINTDTEEMNDSDKEDNDVDYDDENEDDINSIVSEHLESDENLVDDGLKEYVVAKEDRITRPFLTKYELVRIIGTRRKQLSLGAKPMIKIEGKLSINEIVDEEIKLNMVPLKIKRPLPDSNKVEIWEFSELEKTHLIN
ncbi:putative DNA-dependent RNA polymerase subunit Rpb6 [Cafeteria roenbergensis virus]|uniref:Putative DNA-dependent RNA polymerase subunit Rpb6 n=1 Tax=Cafeteria roenbergensis virus (strain BV-PW1) TaxID=693272 RepID=E3T5R2_CROVB|nr:putative DNA-dependent RNA polymerase subunit Rpb6 [Cafeteria roenbergensis virus BV-PW1]ADO67525.1 putative DNA-dependent RNA polymerase subunit Rpb6 [Cafeteria roenbergensis virus BV-PW1]